MKRVLLFITLLALFAAPALAEYPTFTYRTYGGNLLTPVGSHTYLDVRGSGFSTSFYNTPQYTYLAGQEVTRPGQNPRGGYRYGVGIGTYQSGSGTRYQRLDYGNMYYGGRDDYFDLGVQRRYGNQFGGYGAYHRYYDKARYDTRSNQNYDAYGYGRRTYANTYAQGSTSAYIATRTR